MECQKVSLEKKLTDLTIEDIPKVIEGTFNPEWFKISKSMVTMHDQCRQKFGYNYICGIKEKKAGIALLRAIVYRNVLFSVILRDFDDFTSLSQTVTYLVINAIESQALEIAQNRMVDPNNYNKSTLISSEYRFPSGSREFSYNDLIKQIVSAVLSTYSYIRTIPSPAIDNTIGDHEFPIVNKSHQINLLTTDGEIVDETGGKPTRFYCNIEYVDKDGTLYIFKIADKKSYKKDEHAYIGDDAIIAVAGFRSLYPEIFSDPVKVKIVRTVIKKDGSINDNIEFRSEMGKIYGIEEHIRLVTEFDINELVYKYGEKAKEMKEGRIYRQRGNHCGWCAYNKICNHQRDTDGLVIAKHDLGYENLEDTEDYDDMPF